VTKTVKLFVAEYRITNKEQTIDRDEYRRFNSLSAAKAFLDKGMSEWDGSGKGIGNGQIVEYEIWPDGDLPFPAYYESKRIATYSALKTGWERIND
jgi:hypothetical protein